MRWGRLLSSLFACGQIANEPQAPVPTNVTSIASVIALDESFVYWVSSSDLAAIMSRVCR